MCLVTFMKDVHPDYPLILVANRDEEYDRLALPIHRWADYPTVTAGMDLKELGTWLGYTDDGRFIAILNYPFNDWTPTLERPRSRGKLLRDYLTKPFSIPEFEDYLQESRKSYQSYHLLYGTFEELNYYSNATDTFRKFEGGLHTLSNTTDDLSNHRKEYSSELLENHVKNNSNNLELSELTTLMQDKKFSETMENYPKEIDREVAKQYSSIFIQGEDFGTVGTTAILLHKSGKISIQEIKYDRNGITEVTSKEQWLSEFH